MIELLLILATFPQAAPYRPQAAPWSPTRVVEVPVMVEVKREPTDAEKDAQYLRENHWRLSPGSCGMLGCTVHGGGWVLDRVASQGPAQYPGAQRPRDLESAAGHWVTVRRGLFRVQRVWQPTAKSAKPDAIPAPVEPAGKEPTLHGRPAEPAGAGCQNGTCPTQPDRRRCGS